MDQSVVNHFAAMRRSIRTSLRRNWTNSQMRSNDIRQLRASVWGPLYFRQILTVSGDAGGRAFQGVIRLDYSLASGPTYCFNRNTAFTAPAQGFATSLDQLLSVHASQAYSGPGLPPGPNGEPA